MLDIISTQDFNCESASSSAAKSEAPKPPPPITLLPSQDAVSARLNECGDLVIEQTCWPDEDQAILVRAALIEPFVDGLLDLLGVPSAAGPAR